MDEVKATNDIEGVHSTRKEIQDILDGNVSKSERLESIVHKYKRLMDHAEIPFYTCKDIRRFYDDFAHEEIKKKIRNMLWMGLFSEKIRSILSQK